MAHSSSSSSSSSAWPSSSSSSSSSKDGAGRSRFADMVSTPRCRFCAKTEGLRGMSGGKSVCGKCLRKQVSLLVLVEREPLWRILPLFKLSLENLTELIDPEDEYWKALQKTFAHPDPKSLADLHYSFSPSGLLLNSSSGTKYHEVTQEHRERVGRMVAKEVQTRLVDSHGLTRLSIPFDDPNPIAHNYVLASKDFIQKTTLLLVIQGSGGVRPGIWSRSLCIEEGLETGSMEKMVKKALSRDYGILILNPNIADDHKGNPIAGNESPSNHTVYVWDQIVSKSSASSILILAHSRGGLCTSDLVLSRLEQVREKVKAIALTDVAQTEGKAREREEAREFLRGNAVNWVASVQVVDAFEPLLSSDDGCVTCVSAGTPSHERSTSSALSSLFRFFDSRVPRSSSSSSSSSSA